MTDLPDLRVKRKPKNTSEHIDVWIIQNSPQRKCGLDKIGKCDFYMDYSWYKEMPMRIDDEFEKLSYDAGVGIVVKDRSKLSEIRKVFETMDWMNLANRGGKSHRTVSKTDIIELFEEHYE